MSYILLPTQVAGEVIPVDWGNTVRDNFEFFNKLPSCRVYNDDHISIGHDIQIILTFNSERWDSEAMHSMVTNTSRITCVTAGIYRIYANIEFNVSTTGDRYIQVLLNGSTVIGMARVSAAGGSEALIISTEYDLAVNDYIEVRAYQSGGSTGSVSRVANYSPEFGMTWVRATP